MGEKKWKKQNETEWIERILFLTKRAFCFVDLKRARKMPKSEAKHKIWMSGSSSSRTLEILSNRLLWMRKRYACSRGFTIRHTLLSESHSWVEWNTKKGEISFCFANSKWINSVHDTQIFFALKLRFANTTVYKFNRARWAERTTNLSDLHKLLFRSK